MPGGRNALNSATANHERKAGSCNDAQKVGAARKDGRRTRQNPKTLHRAAEAALASDVVLRPALSGAPSFRVTLALREAMNPNSPMTRGNLLSRHVRT